MAVTAIITMPMDGANGDSGTEDPYHIAGYTIEQFSADASSLSGADTEIVDVQWSDDLGWTDNGRHVSRRFDTTGTHIVTVTVKGNGGGVGTTTRTVTSAAFSPGWDRYVKQGGNDADTGVDDAHAWATIEHAFDRFTVSGLTKGQVGSIRLKLGSTISFTGNGTGQNSPSPGHGFLICTTYGVGAKPQINCTDGTSITVLENSHIPLEWGWPVFIRDWNFTWDGRNANNGVFLGNPGSQMDGCVLTRGSTGLQGNRKHTFINGTITNAGHDGVFASTPWCILSDSTISVNDLNGVNAQHQVYGSAGLSHFTYRRLRVIGSVEGNDGLRAVSARLGSIADCEVSNIFNAGDAFFPAANGALDARCDKPIIERCWSHDTSSQSSGLHMSLTQDALVRNTLFSAHSGACVILQGFDSTHKSDNSRLYNCTFYGNLGTEVRTDTFATNNRSINNIFAKTSTGAFYDIGTLSNFTSDYNCFWKPGCDASTGGLFIFPGATTGSFNDWKNVTGKDAHSIFADPLFTNPAANDFTLQLNSPCRNAGTTLPEVLSDYVRTARPQGSQYDMGAYEALAPPPAPTAIITRSAQTQLIAGLTRIVFSGMDSYLTTASPSDAWSSISDWTWSFGDGTFGSGAVVGHVFPASGTYPVSLTVTSKTGTQSSTTMNITIVAFPALSFEKFVKASGSDSNNGNSDALAYRTMDKAIDAWNSTNPWLSTNWGRINVHAGDAVTFSTNNLPIASGPLIVQAYGGSSRPTMVVDNSIINGNGFTIAWTGRDNTYTRPVFWDGVNITFLGGTFDNRSTDSSVWNLIGVFHVAAQVSNTAVTNAGFQLSASGDPTGPHGSSLYNVSATGSYRNGVFFSTKYSLIEGCLFYANGHYDPAIGDRDNQIYASAATFNCGIRSTFIDQGTITARGMGGINCSGVNKLYLADVRFRSSGSLALRNGFGVGGNNLPAGESSNDVIAERLNIQDVANDAMSAQYGSRVSFRNPSVIRAGQGLWLYSYNSGQYIDGLELIAGSFSDVSCGIFYQNGSAGLTRNILVENSSFRQSTSGTGVADHVLVQVAGTADLSTLTMKTNQYYRNGDFSSTATFGFLNGVLISLDTWKSQYGKDTTSQYGDPLYIDYTSNLHLQSGSPCINAGTSTAIDITSDADGTTRTAPFDIGAFEFTSNGNTGGGTGVLRGTGSNGAGTATNGNGSGAFHGLGADADGFLGFNGSGSGAIGGCGGGLGSNGVGTSGIQGTGSGVVHGLGANGVGSAGNVGTGTGAFRGVGANGIGGGSNSGSGTGAIKGLGANGIALAGNGGSGTGVLNGLGANGQGGTALVGTGTGVLNGLGANGTGGTSSGSGTGVLNGVGANGVGLNGIRGSGTGAFHGIGASGVGGFIKGLGTGVLNGVGANGTGGLSYAGSGTGVLHGLGANGIGGFYEASGTGVLSGVGANGQGNLGTVGTGTGAIPGLGSNGTGTVYMITGIGTGVLSGLGCDASGGGSYGTGTGSFGGVGADGEGDIALVINLRSDLYVSLGQQGGTGVILPGPIDNPSSGTLSIRVGDVYIDVQNHRPMRVMSVGATIVFQVITNPKVPGPIISMSLQRARTLILQKKLRRVSP